MTSGLPGGGGDCWQPTASTAAMRPAAMRPVIGALHITCRRISAAARRLVAAPATWRQARRPAGYRRLVAGSVEVQAPLFGQPERGRAATAVRHELECPAIRFAGQGDGSVAERAVVAQHARPEHGDRAPEWPVLV